MKQHNAGALLIVASAAGFATLGILIKFAFAAGASITTIMAVRFLLAALCLVIVLRWRGVPLRLGRRGVVELTLMGAVGYGGMSMLFANGIHYLPASLAGLLLYTYPALVSLLSFLLGDERFTGRKGLALVLCLVGMVLVLNASFSGARLAGVLSILGAAGIYSCYIVIGNRLLKRLDPLVTSVYVCGTAGLAALLFGLATGSLTLLVPPAGWLAMLGIAIFPTMVGVIGFFAGLRLVGGTNAAIISTLEPLITIILSALLLGETITPLQGLGGAILLTGVIVLQLWGKDGTAAAMPAAGSEAGR